MPRSFGIVEDKVAEADFFLEKMAACGINLLEAGFYFSAFASAARSVTFALQASLTGVDGFSEWYEPRQRALSKDPLARFFVDARNFSQKVGLNPVVGGSMVSTLSGPGHILLNFGPPGYHKELPATPRMDVISACRHYVASLVQLLRECHARFGPIIDPYLYYTAEAFGARGLGIEDAEEELFGIRGWTSAPDIPESERWRLLRESVPGSSLPEIFEKYPQSEGA